MSAKWLKLEIQPRNIMDYKLSRYACYLIEHVIKWRSKKKIIALGQKYFAIQICKQEDLLSEIEEIKPALS